jgi:hypothetical protein
MALCLTFYMVDGSRLFEDISPVCTILHSINWGLNTYNAVFLYKLILHQLLNIFSFTYWQQPFAGPSPQDRRIKSKPSYPISFRSIPTLPSLQRLCFPHDLSTSEFPTIISYEFLISLLPTLHHTHHILLEFIGLMFGKKMPAICKASRC